MQYKIDGLPEQDAERIWLDRESKWCTYCSAMKLQPHDHPEMVEVVESDDA